MADEEGQGRQGGPSLEFTPTWVAALLCTAIVTLSLTVEKVLCIFSKRLKKLNRRFLFKALQKLKEELMLMGLLSLLLASLQDVSVRLCIPESWAQVGLPCKPRTDYSTASTSTTTAKLGVGVGVGHRLLASESHFSHCPKGKVPLVSYHALHDLHILIFVLAVVHVAVCAFTVLFGAAKISQWRRWEESILNKINDKDVTDEILHVKHGNFIKNRIWLNSFIKHLYHPVSESDYAAMRVAFVSTHCSGRPSFDFYQYMINAFEADFVEVVSISWHVWGIVIISLLLNLAGWRTYFWIAFLPLIIVLIVGTKLEQVIILLAAQVVQRQANVGGDVETKLSDSYFWFKKPRIFLLLIRVAISCNAFAVALFFWISSRYGFQACSMGRPVFTIPKLVIVWVAHTTRRR